MNPIKVEVTETRTLTFELWPEDIVAIIDDHGEFTQAATRSYAIDVFESGDVEIQLDGYDVRVNLDFDDAQAVEEAENWAEL